jgi:hypothetical protein
VVRSSVYQLFIRPSAGLSQLLFVIILSNHLKGLELNDALYILSLAIFFIFLDFGTLYNAYREACINSGRNNQVKQSVIAKYQRQSINICGINLLISVPLLLNSTTFLMGMYIAITALTIPGLVSMHLLRGFGKEFHFLILFNSSWPISLFCLLLVSSQTGRIIFDNKYLAFLPSLATIICGFFAIATCAKIKTRQTRNRETLDKYIGQRIAPIFVVISGALALQTDKILVIRTFDISGSTSYLVSGILMVSTISSVVALGSNAWGSNMSSPSARYKFYFKEFTIIGIITSTLYFLGIIVLNELGLLNFSVNISLILTFAFTILIYAFLTVVQSFATFKSYFYWTSTGNLIQALTVMGLSFVLGDSLTVNLLAFIVAIGAILNLTYLIIRTRVLTSSNYC